MKLKNLFSPIVSVALLAGVSLAQATPPAASSGASASPNSATGSSSPSPAAAQSQSAAGGRRLTPEVTSQIKSEVQDRQKDAQGTSLAAVSVSLPHGRRDPFVSPLLIVKKDAGSIIQAACLSGRRCLNPDQLILKGVVKSREGMMAMVESPNQKSYVLHERDEIYRGSVAKITTDSITFRQSTSDSLGHSSQRTIVKRIQSGSATP